MAARIRDAGPQVWSDEFATPQSTNGPTLTNVRRLVSARDRYLHASNSYCAAEYFSPFSTDRHVELGLASRGAFLTAMADSGVQELWLPWCGQRLPGYWFTPPGATEAWSTRT